MANTNSDYNPSTTTPAEVVHRDESIRTRTPYKVNDSVYEILMSQERDPIHRHYNHVQALHRPIDNNDPNNMNVSNNTTTNAIRSIPYFLPWTPQVGRKIDLPPDVTWLSNACGSKAAIGVFGGGMMGLLMGVFLGAMSDATPPVLVIAGKDVPQAPLREQMRITMRATADKSLYWCRNFALLSGVFAGSECLVEKYRGKHDVWNAVASGCITGAALQAKSGPQAAAVGCGGFAAFSLVIDSFMGNH